MQDSDHEGHDYTMYESGGGKDALRILQLLQEKLLCLRFSVKSPLNWCNKALSFKAHSCFPLKHL